MEEEKAFENPDLDISERDLIDTDSDDYQDLAQLLHSEILTTNPVYYCPTHHAIITRAAKKHHTSDTCEELVTRAQLLSN